MADALDVANALIRAEQTLRVAAARDSEAAVTLRRDDLHTLYYLAKHAASVALPYIPPVPDVESR